MKVALFADLHGRILLCLKLVERYQRETGETIDLILQCGDVGIFPNINDLDSATRRFAQKDPSELGFYEYFSQANPKTAALWDKLECNLVCVRGNHEDHAFLDELEAQSKASQFAVDYYQRLFVCKTGIKQSFTKGNDSFTYCGIGRIGDNRGREKPINIQAYEQAQLNQLLKQKDPHFDVLITHDSAMNFVTFGYGMEEIREALNIAKPKHHFFGHTGTPFRNQLDENNKTQSWKIAELEFKHGADTLSYGCMLVMHITENTINKIETIDAPWLKEYNQETWLYR